MSTIVYQELLPCNESRTLSLKLSSQTCSNKFLKDLSSKFESSNCSWSEIELLSTKTNTTEKEEQTYVHPLVKRSSFKLSEKSLEMCTESLGSETGSCAMESSIFFPSMTMEERRKPREKLEKRKEIIFIDPGNFPPPLTTISGSNLIHVRPYRQDGRLVIEAVRTPPIHSYMQAERSDGRLKLSMVRDYDSDNDDCCSSAQHCDCQTTENEEACVQEDVKSGECHRCDAYFLEDLKGITVEFGVSIGLGKLQRPSRCKEGGQGSKRLINWEPFWVAT